jgi:hypothetical protein
LQSSHLPGYYCSQGCSSIVSRSFCLTRFGVEYTASDTNHIDHYLVGLFLFSLSCHPAGNFHLSLSASPGRFHRHQTWRDQGPRYIYSPQAVQPALPVRLPQDVVNDIIKSNGDGPINWKTKNPDAMPGLLEISQLFGGIKSV